MKYPKELCALMIKNMEIMEKAPLVIEAIEKELFTAINRKIKDFADERNWEGVYDLVTNEGNLNETSFKPKGWPSLEKGLYLAWYGLTYSPSNNSGYWLSHVVRVSNMSLSLAFFFNPNYFQEQAKRSLVGLLNCSEELRNKRFNFIEGSKEFHHSVGIEICFEAESLANDYLELDGDFDLSLKPLDDALNTLFNVHDKFNSFVKSLNRKV